MLTPLVRRYGIGGRREMPTGVSTARDGEAAGSRPSPRCPGPEIAVPTCTQSAGRSRPCEQYRQSRP